MALPGCNCCMLRAPRHRLTCQHRFCHYCLETTAHKAITACPLCGGPNGEEVITIPPTAGIRALVLSDASPVRTVEFLAALRRKLHGHLEDYFDMIVASKAGMIATIPSLCSADLEIVAPVVVDYFCNRTSLLACFRRLTESRKTAWQKHWPAKIQEVPYSRTSICIIDGDRLVSNYSVPRHLGAKRPRRWLTNSSAVSSQTVSLAQVAATECAKLWDSCP